MPHDFAAFESPARSVKGQRCAKDKIKHIVNNNITDGSNNNNDGTDSSIINELRRF